MSITKEKRAVYTFESPALKTLQNATRQSEEVKVIPKELGFRLLPDYFGSDVIEVLVVLPPEFNVDDMTYSDTFGLKRVIRTWANTHFPEYTVVFSFAQ